MKWINALGAFSHLGRFRTWGVFALGAFLHLGRFRTWGVFTLGAFLHSIIPYGYAPSEFKFLKIE